MVEKWQGKGWEFVSQKERRFLTEMTFRRAPSSRNWYLLVLRAVLVLSVVAGIVAATVQLPSVKDPFAEVRADADAAIKALRHGDLVALEAHLAANRGQPDFAYLLASRSTPRALGDALASVAGESKGAPLKADVDPLAYETTLVDLAGTLGLATFGTGDRSLPEEWTDDFITASTTPYELYGEDVAGSEESGQDRADQDLANKQNLLLLLSRGYWSTEFLKEVTEAFWEYDHAQGDDAWPGVVIEGARYAPAPTGRYLTDGILALTAALTANPAASEWAFTEFQADTVKIDDSDYGIGRFTHFLMFEHEFPRSEGESVGLTATLTALSSAIESASWSTPSLDAPTLKASSNDAGPMRDVVVLQTLARDLAESDCSWNPMDYGHCVVDAVKAIWRWVQRWGHLVLDILTVATSFAPPPFNVVSLAPAALNATWYAIEGDYGTAGLSLAAVVPGLAFGKIAQAMKAGVKASKGAKTSVQMEKAAEQSDSMAEAARKIRSGADVAAQRVTLRPVTVTKIREAAPKTADGNFIDPNTGKAIVRGQEDIGHKPGYEWRCIQAKAVENSWTREQLIEYANDPRLYQIEDRSSNRSHKYEAESCAR